MGYLAWTGVETTVANSGKGLALALRWLALGLMGDDVPHVETVGLVLRQPLRMAIAGAVTGVEMIGAGTSDGVPRIATVELVLELALRQLALD